jgi:hypothetical protein
MNPVFKGWKNMQKLIYSACMLRHSLISYASRDTPNIDLFVSFFSLSIAYIEFKHAQLNLFNTGGVRETIL